MTQNAYLGIIAEYYEVFKIALRSDLKREPTEEEIMEKVNLIIAKCKE
jgi:hypothetical protein